MFLLSKKWKHFKNGVDIFFERNKCWLGVKNLGGPWGKQKENVPESSWCGQAPFLDPETRESIDPVPFSKIKINMCGYIEMANLPQIKKGNTLKGGITNNLNLGLV